MHFYEEVLGFSNGPRPRLRSISLELWLYSSGHPVLHLNDISHTDKQQRAEFPA